MEDTMRNHFSCARLIVVLALGLTSTGPGQEYYTRTAGPANPGGILPIIGNQGMFSGPDIQLYPSANHQSEVSIAVNWCNTNNLLAGCNAVGGFGYSQGYFYSEDRGVTWMGSEQLPGIPYYTSDPAIAFDTYNIGNPNGYANGYFNFLSLEGFFYGLSVQKTTDGGETWLPAVEIPNAGDPDKNHMTIDATMGVYGDNIYVGYTDFADFPESPIRLSRSTDRGATFSTPVNISLGTTSLFSQGVNLAVGPQGHVYAVWAIYDDWSDPDPIVWDEEAIGFARSTNGGATWESPRRILEIQGIRGLWFHKNPTSSPIRVNSFPVLAVDRSGGAYDGRMYLVWANAGAGADKANIHLSRSTDGGATWSTPLRVNNENGFNDQWFPWVSVSPYGRVTIVFYDSRNDVSPPSNQLTEAWIAESTDGGLTFVNTRVSDVAFTPVPVPNTATGYMGDYLGITSSAGRAYPCWADNRTGVYQLFVDIQDSYIADLRNLAATSRSPAQFATAYGSSPKIVFAGGKWHRLFQVNEYIAYSQSADDGTTWTGSTLIAESATGWLSNPSLYSSGGKLHTVFRSDDGGVYHCRGTFDGVWEVPRRLASVQGTVRGIASVVDNSGVGHVLYSSIPSQSSTCYLSYGTFNAAAPVPVLGTVTNIGFSTTPIERIAAAVDAATGAPHVVWENNGEILHRYKPGNIWLAMTNVSASEEYSGFPVLALLNGTAHVAWEEDVSGNGEIYYKTRTPAGVWSNTANLSNSDGASVHPSIVCPVNSEPLVLWSDSTAGSFDLRYSLPLTGETDMLVSGGPDSRYPVCGVRNTRTAARVVFLCTDGSSSLYEIGSGKMDFIPGGGELRSGEDRLAMGSGGLLLAQNTPNPFNPSTQIRFSIPSAGPVSLRVYDIIGQEIATLLDEHQPAGEHTVSFEGTGLPSGIYMYRLQHDSGVRVGRMILAR
jgi:hypothetical protein